MPIPSAFPPAGLLQPGDVVGIVQQVNPNNPGTGLVRATTLQALLGFFNVTSGVGYLEYTSPSGTVNNVTPETFNEGINRVDVALTAATTWTGLTAGADGQQVILRNLPTNAFTLTLDIASGSSSAGNQFSGAVAALALPPGNSQTLMYYAGSVNKWVLL